MAANVDALIRDGMNAFKAGRKEDARALLMRAVEADQYSEQAWLWLSAAVDSAEDQRTCLENVLSINPNNERARKGLQVLNAKSAPKSEPPAAFGVGASDFGGDFPTSVEWGAPEPDPAPPSPPKSSEISDDDYDSWVANLNLPAPGSPPSGDSFFTAPPADTSSFVDSLPADTSSLFDSPPDDVSSYLDSAGSVSAFIGGPFSTDDFETDFASETFSPHPAPSAGVRAPASVMSPDEDEVTFDDLDLHSTGVFAQFEDEDFADAELSELNPQELFRYIPSDIKPTRLPGTVERFPVFLLLGFILLLALNVGAVALLVYRLS